jgi:outer membrane protein TolC
MVRGPLEPMWAVSVGLPLPVFAGARQSRALAQADAEKEASSRGVEAVEQLLALRAHQRVESMKALSAVWKSFQEGLLAQADAAAESTAAQFATGRATFAAVLDANAVSISETDASLQVLAEGWRLVIAQDELSPAELPSAPVALTAPTSSPAAGM